MDPPLVVRRGSLDPDRDKASAWCKARAQVKLGRPGGRKVDLSLQDNLEIPYNWIVYIHHVGSSHDCNSIIHSGMIAGGERYKKEGRQTVFFTPVDPMREPHKEEPCDVTEPRKVRYRTKWKVYQNAVYWIKRTSALDRD